MNRRAPLLQNMNHVCPNLTTCYMKVKKGRLLFLAVFASVFWTHYPYSEGVAAFVCPYSLEGDARSSFPSLFSCKLRVNVTGRSTSAESAVQRKRVETWRWINQCRNHGGSLLFYSPPQHQNYHPSLLFKRAPHVSAPSIYLVVTGGV